MTARHNFRKHKYNAKPTEVDGIMFGSKAEARKYVELRTLQQAGEVLGFLRQVPMHLPGKVVYRMDFLVFYSDGTCKGIEVKGFETPEWKIKAKQVADLFPWFDLEVCR